LPPCGVEPYRLHILSLLSGYRWNNDRNANEADVITLINVFTVDPANQQRLIDILTRATDASVCQAEGFISARLHRSTDGAKVTMYAQWRSLYDYEAMRRDPAPLPFFQEALSIARFEPGVYEVVRTFLPADA
jgi:quinol monooxygenase YgiN